MYKCLIFLLCLTLVGCASIPPEVKAVAESPNTFATCKAVDIGTTAAIISHGGRELNPIAKGLISHGYIPIILLSVGIYWLLKENNEPKATMAVNAITCPVAAHNVLVLAGAL